MRDLSLPMDDILEVLDRALGDALFRFEDKEIATAKSVIADVKLGIVDLYLEEFKKEYRIHSEEEE